MEGLSWTEIEAQQAGARNRLRKHHAQAIDTLCDAAQRRLGELGHLAEVLPDELFRFRLNGPGRLWGLRVPEDDTFYVLWWDANHAVYPTDKS